MRNKLSEIWRAAFGKQVGLSLLFLACAGLSLGVFAAEPSELTLPQASERLIHNHPELKQFAWRFKALEAEAAQASLRPDTSIALETADIAGSGDYQGLKSAETTLSLSSAFELGNKRQARMQASNARVQLAQAEQDAQLMALLSTLTQQFVQSLALQEQCALKQEGAQLALQTQQIVSERVNKAAAPEAELLRAKVGLIQAKLALSNCQVELAVSQQELATFMGQKAADFDRLQGDLYLLKPLAPLPELETLLQSSPRLAVFAQQQVAQQAELAQIKADSSVNLQWSLGITHYAASDDAALGLGLDVPLFAGKRNQPRLAQAQAQVSSLTLQQQQAEQAFYAILYRHTQLHRQNSLSVQRLRHEAIPLLERAYQQAKQAYQQGRYSYSEWANARQELLNTKAEMINAAANAWLNQAAIEALIGGL